MNLAILALCSFVKSESGQGLSQDGIPLKKAKKNQIYSKIASPGETEWYVLLHMNITHVYICANERKKVVQ